MAQTLYHRGSGRVRRGSGEGQGRIRESLLKRIAEGGVEEIHSSYFNARYLTNAGPKSYQLSAI